MASLLTNNATSIDYIYAAAKTAVAMNAARTAALVFVVVAVVVEVPPLGLSATMDEFVGAIDGAQLGQDQVGSL